MHRCETCDRVFKNGAGLAGHNQWKHGFERSGQPPSTSVPERLSQRSESGEEALLEHLEQQNHVECNHELALQSYEQGRAYGIYEALGTVGVVEAVKYHQQAARWNRKHPNHLMVENWSDLPGVQEILDSSEPRLIRIVRSNGRTSLGFK